MKYRLFERLFPQPVRLLHPVNIYIDCSAHQFIKKNITYNNNAVGRPTVHPTSRIHEQFLRRQPVIFIEQHLIFALCAVNIMDTAYIWSTSSLTVVLECPSKIISVSPCHISDLVDAHFAKNLSDVKSISGCRMRCFSSCLNDIQQRQRNALKRSVANGY